MAAGPVDGAGMGARRGRRQTQGEANGEGWKQETGAWKQTVHRQNLAIAEGFKPREP